MPGHHPSANGCTSTAGGAGSGSWCGHGGCSALRCRQRQPPESEFSPFPGIAFALTTPGRSRSGTIKISVRGPRQPEMRPETGAAGVEAQTFAGPASRCESRMGLPMELLLGREFF